MPKPYLAVILRSEATKDLLLAQHHTEAPLLRATTKKKRARNKFPAPISKF
jgi:hypothetical protein